jgi:hypothetical protein
LSLDGTIMDRKSTHGKSEGTSHMQIQLLKKRKGFGAFQFLIFVLPAAPAAATIVETATTIGVKAAATVEVTSTATTIAC